MAAYGSLDGIADDPSKTTGKWKALGPAPLERSCVAIFGLKSSLYRTRITPAFRCGLGPRTIQVGAEAVRSRKVTGDAIHHVLQRREVQISVRDRNWIALLIDRIAIGTGARVDLGELGNDFRNDRVSDIGIAGPIAV
ncbi:hypothetical protein [Qipengyuania flava]|uniref:hypothetical protein n=1 Tax=Qipengyuania flava TaxID=192812 RepID=UPI00273E923A|nr:hypothetical protein [Qipengyuania flava]